jgi:hypothetical protein
MAEQRLGLADRGLQAATASRVAWVVVTWQARQSLAQ